MMLFKILELSLASAKSVKHFSQKSITVPNHNLCHSKLGHGHTVKQTTIMQIQKLNLVVSSFYVQPDLKHSILVSYTKDKI